MRHMGTDVSKNETTIRRLLAPASAATALVVAVTLASVPQAQAVPRAEVVASTARVAGAALAGVQQAARPERRVFTPRSGVIVTDPRRTDRRKLLNHVVKSIAATKRRQFIRIISWNVFSRVFVDRLIGAHRRGVSVRLLMAAGKAEGNPYYARLRRELRDLRPKDRRLPPKFRSWARVCEGSCRGTRGIAHSKLFIFSKVGRARRVVMSSSANATEVAVAYQWNDLYTQVGNRAIYSGFVKAFAEAAEDRPVRRGYKVFRGRDVIGYVYPWRGRDAKGDRVIKELQRIRCVGAQGGTGINGRTRIRIAQDAILNDRGVRISQLLRTKWENGCNIRIVYALLGHRSLGILRHTSRGPVPIQQIVSDWNDDGVYDRYMHSKVMAVSGWYARDRSTRIAWQGSENWSGLATISDEQGFRIRRSGAEGVYARWVDYLFHNPPPPPPEETLRLARSRGIDPYALIKEELGIPARGTR